MDNYSPKSKLIKETNCVRRIRFSTTQETLAEDNDSIIVYARIKPLGHNEDTFIDFNDKTIKYQEIDKRGTQKVLNFSFHHVFGPKITQKKLYQHTIDDDINRLITGENILLFAYGTSSSGKSYTVLGTNEEPGILPRSTFKLFMSVANGIVESPFCPDRGADVRKLTVEEYDLMKDHRDTIITLIEECNKPDMIPDIDCFGLNDSDVDRMMNQLYDDINLGENSMEEDDCKYSIWISYLEVYNENIYDLLNIMIDQKPLKIGYDSGKNNYVKGLWHINVTTWSSLWKLFLYGQSRLHKNETTLNRTSSRSHSVFTIKLIKLSMKGHEVSSLSLCDLAGTERQKKANIAGEIFKESRNINTSLLVLNRCFSIVRENKVASVKKIPPFRESKLTLIFQKAFSYGERIRMIVNIHQSKALAEESKTVLKMSAVAQEMVRPIPKHNRIKPNSRFSMACMNPEQPIHLYSVSAFMSGVNMLTSSSTFSVSEETVKQYESKIQELECDNKKKSEEIKSLLEMVEDARTEYLDIEKKYEESEEALAEQELLVEELESEIDDLKMYYDSKIGAFKDLDVNFEAERTKNKDLQQRINELEQELQKTKTAKKGKQLLNAIVHLDIENSIPVDDDSYYSASKAANKTRSPRSTRKCKKGLFNKQY